MLWLWLQSWWVFSEVLSWLLGLVSSFQCDGYRGNMRTMMCSDLGWAPPQIEMDKSDPKWKKNAC